MIIRVLDDKRAEVCDGLLTKLIQDERQYNKFIDEKFIVKDYFKNVISCTDIGEGKSSPKVYIECCNIMNTIPSETLVVEDSLSALTTAKNTGFKTMAVFDGTQKRFWKKLQELADYTVDSDFDISIIEKIQIK